MELSVYENCCSGFVDVELGDTSVAVPEDAVDATLRLWEMCLAPDADSVGPDTCVLLDERSAQRPPVWALADDDTAGRVSSESEERRQERLEVYTGILQDAVRRGEAVPVPADCRDRWEYRVAADAVRQLLWGEGDATASPEGAEVVSAREVLKQVEDWAAEA